ncbi:MAG: response regulator [Methanoregula sp.]|nr:response regulator [Methanoregula sp.]
MGRASVLVVEDDPVVVPGITGMLADMGYSVCGIAATGEKAVEETGRLHPDIILMDIELAGPMTGIDAAEQIRKLWRIPVIYLTAHAEEEYLEKAKITEPFGYILKPVKMPEEIRTTIELALYKHAMEKKLDEISPDPAGPRTIFVRKALGGITLLLHKRDANRFPLFKHLLETGIADHVGCMYAYFQTNLVAYFARAVAEGELQFFELREGMYLFDQWFDRACGEAAQPGSGKKLFCIADVSNLKDPDVVLHIRKKFREAEQVHPGIFSGILAIPLDDVRSPRNEELYEGINHVILFSGEGNIVSFTPPIQKPLSVKVVPQEIMDSVVKKSLDVLILSCLQRPVTGYGIIREINERFHVVIPLASVYTHLYQLEKDGILKVTQRGNARFYSPTKEGETYIRNRLSEINTAYEQVLGSRE